MTSYCPCGLKRIARPGRSGVHCPIHRTQPTPTPVVVGPVSTRVPMDAVKGYGGAPEVSAWVLASALLSGEAN